MNSWTYRFAILFLGLAALVLVSCGQQPADEAQPAAEPQAFAEPIAEHMGEHYEQVTAAQKAVIRGDIGSMRAPVEWMVSHQSVVGAPEGWAPHIKEMRDVAGTALEAEELATAASAVAAMSRTCGKCHEAVGAEARAPELGTLGVPPPGEVDTVPHMLRHYWAVQKMWIGIINPSEESWNEGLSALEDAPLEPQKMTDDADMTASVGEWAESVHGLSAGAAQATDWDTRATVYGQLLTTCAQCHQELGIDVTLN